MTNPSTDWKEVIPTDEDARFERYAAQLAQLQAQNAIAGTPGRAPHHKGTGAFEASLEILADLPAHARHGLFAKPARYDALVRFSNGASRVQKDDAGDVRGIAVKVLGVDGPKVLGTARTQDFLAILSPATPFRNADEFVAMVWAARNPALALPRVLGALGFRGLGLLRQPARRHRPAGDVARHPPASSSALPIQCGPYAARFALTPVSAPDAAPTSGPDPACARRRSRRCSCARDPSSTLSSCSSSRTKRARPSRMRRSTLARGRRAVRARGASWCWRSRTRRASRDARPLHARVEALSFDPWHALVEHKPLGNMMRARKHAYFASTRGRSAQAEG